MYTSRLSLSFFSMYIVNMGGEKENGGGDEEGDRDIVNLEVGGREK